MDRDLRGFRVTNFADHDDVGILANKSAQSRGKCQTDRGLCLRLIDTLKFVFDRVLDGEDFARWFIENR